MIVLSFSANSQSLIRLGPSLSFGVSVIKFDEFKSFANSYVNYVNNFYNTDEYKLKGFNPSATFSYGITGNIGLVFLDYDFGKITSRAKVEFDYGEYRKFEFKRFNSNIFHGIMIGSEEVYIAIGVGVHVINSKLFSSYVYKDGIESFGNEKVLNGVYKILATKMSVGGRLGVVLNSHLMLGIKADYLFGSLGPTLGLTDYSEATFNTGGIPNWQYLPKDFDPNQSSVDVSEAVHETWGEFVFKFTLSYLLTK